MVFGTSSCRYIERVHIGISTESETNIATYRFPLTVSAYLKWSPGLPVPASPPQLSLFYNYCVILLLLLSVYCL